MKIVIFKRKLLFISVSFSLIQTVLLAGREGVDPVEERYAEEEEEEEEEEGYAEEEKRGSSKNYALVRNVKKSVTRTLQVGAVHW